MQDALEAEREDRASGTWSMTLEQTVRFIVIMMMMMIMIIIIIVIIMIIIIIIYIHRVKYYTISTNYNMRILVNYLILFFSINS